MVRDLVALVADKNIEFALKGLFARSHSLHVSSFSYEVFVHPYRDPVCLRKAHTYLAPFADKYRYALVVFDKEGSGRESLTREDAETIVRTNMESSGWPSRCECIVIDPELEAWIWTRSPKLTHVLRYPHSIEKLRQDLVEKGLWRTGCDKPDQPKEALEKILYELKRPRSSSLFFDVAQSVSLRRCSDESFIKLTKTLRQWFPLPQ